ncbi:hypothetical protein, conserved [Leishmania tarentolae]|uniref:Uncharacterized protein n=1 Tax=Leishmania tarentolae TaxID=5689 RepID=A0A640KVC7_LEITA|nr:hypothetical protein, conserved [Leishmania tarentolae]
MVTRPAASPAAVIAASCSAVRPPSPILLLPAEEAVARFRHVLRSWETVIHRCAVTSIISNIVSRSRSVKSDEETFSSRILRTSSARKARGSSGRWYSTSCSRCPKSSFKLCCWMYRWVSCTGSPTSAELSDATADMGR